MRQLADWTTHRCYRRLSVLSFRPFGGNRELSSPRLVQSASWRIRELSSYHFHSALPPLFDMATAATPTSLVGGHRKSAEFRTRRPASGNDVIVVVVVVVTLTLMTSRAADAAAGGAWRGGRRAAVTWYDDVTEYGRDSVPQRDDPTPLNEVDN